MKKDCFIKHAFVRRFFEKWERKQMHCIVGNKIFHSHRSGPKLAYLEVSSLVCRGPYYKYSTDVGDFISIKKKRKKCQHYSLFWWLFILGDWQMVFMLILLILQKSCWGNHSFPFQVPVPGLHLSASSSPRICTQQERESGGLQV